MRAKLALQKIQKQLIDIQKKYLLDPEFDINVYKQIMAERWVDEARILDELSNSKTETETMVVMLNDLLPKLARLSDIFFTWPLYRQQLFIRVVFSFPVLFWGRLDNPFYTSDVWRWSTDIEWKKAAQNWTARVGIWWNPILYTASEPRTTPFPFKRPLPGFYCLIYEIFRHRGSSLKTSVSQLLHIVYAAWPVCRQQSGFEDVISWLGSYYTPLSAKEDHLRRRKRMDSRKSDKKELTCLFWVWMM